MRGHSKSTEIIQNRKEGPQWETIQKQEKGHTEGK